MKLVLKIAAGVVLAAVLVAALASTALASRLPTERERASIVRGLPLHVRKPAARACVSYLVRVSNDGRYATAEPRARQTFACRAYWGNGFWLLQRRSTEWRRIYAGSDPPPCSLRVPRDLIRCLG